MQLTNSQQRILERTKGPFPAKCMQWLIEWGEVDPVSGRVIAAGHPLEGASLRGKVLVIRSTKGSSATPLVMGLAHAEGNAPVATQRLTEESGLQGR